jgi:hypothetical protein
MKISELLDGIAKQDLVLPEFQREYVWGKEQSKRLMVSLTKEYPVGSLLFWKTDTPPELKNIDTAPEKLGTVQVILDGQQRLTTLYMLMRGEIPPYYQKHEITHDPRDLYFNLDTGEFQYYQRTVMQDNPIWVRVIDCFRDEFVEPISIASKISQLPEETMAIATRLNKNLNRLRGTEKDDLPAQTVPSHAKLEDSINIFDWINSQGTKLTDADLALTHVTSKWPQARRVIKEKLETLEKAHFYLDLTFMTRALTGVVCHRALYETIHSRPRNELEAGWEKLDKILDYLVTFLPQRAYIHSTWDLNTTNVLIPLIVYLSIHNGKFPNDTAIKHALHWLFIAQTWSRYTSQTDQRLEADISIILKENSPWKSLRNQIIDQRGRIEVKADDLDGRGIQHPLYNMAFIIAKAQGAMDWFSGSPLGVQAGRTYDLQNSYIFPASLLYKNGFESDNHMHRKMVNEIANRMVLTTTHPCKDQVPSQYFPAVEKAFPGALTKQFVSMDPSSWTLENYQDFLAARRETIARKINEFLGALISEPEILHKKSAAELIQLGESATLEFKSTFQWDVVQGTQNTHLKTEVLKTIAAFLNSLGGTLVIGVEDDGNVLGIQRDIKLAQNSHDGFQKLLASSIKETLGAQFSPYLTIRFEKIDEKREICVIDVDSASEPAYMRTAKGTEFYIRLASTSHSLNPEETVNYINSHWS